MSCSNLLSICRHDCLLLLHAKVCSEICREFSTRCTFWAIGRDNILRKTNSVTLVATFYVHTSQFNLISLHRFWGGGDFSQIWVGWVAVGGQICLWEKGGGQSCDKSTVKLSTTVAFCDMSTVEILTVYLSTVYFSTSPLQNIFESKPY